MSKYFTIVPAGSGLWVSDSTGKTAKYFTQSGTPLVTIPIGGSLVAGDTSAAYVETLGNNSKGAIEDQLWRYPIDGSTPTQIATAPTLDGSSLDYGGGPLPNSNGDGFLQIWTTRSGTQQLRLILLQWTPLK
jgi:Tol biopolymer transport system component